MTDNLSGRFFINEFANFNMPKQYPITLTDRNKIQWQKIGTLYIKHSDLPEKTPNYLIPTESLKEKKEKVLPLTPEQKLEIINFWRTENDNRISTIVEKLGYRKSQVYQTIEDHTSSKSNNMK